jgi:hypothetical protein
MTGSPIGVLGLTVGDAQPVGFAVGDLGKLALPTLPRLSGEQDYEPIPGLAEYVLVAVHEVIVELEIISRPGWGGERCGFGDGYSRFMVASRSTSLLVIFSGWGSRAPSRSSWKIRS